MCDQIYNQGSILLLMTAAEETLVSTRIKTQGASSLASGVFISDPVLWQAAQNGKKTCFACQTAALKR